MRDEPINNQLPLSQVSRRRKILRHNKKSSKVGNKDQCLCLKGAKEYPKSLRCKYISMRKCDHQTGRMMIKQMYCTSSWAGTILAQTIVPAPPFKRVDIIRESKVLGLQIKSERILYRGSKKVSLDRETYVLIHFQARASTVNKKISQEWYMELTKEIDTLQKGEKRYSRFHIEYCTKSVGLSRKVPKIQKSDRNSTQFRKWNIRAMQPQKKYDIIYLVMSDEQGKTARSPLTFETRGDFLKQEKNPKSRICAG